MNAVSLDYVRKFSGVGRARRLTLDDVSLTAADGTITTILGSSSAGQSELMRIMIGMDVADAGLVLVDGVDLSAVTEAERDQVRATTLGVLYSTGNLFPSLTLAQNLNLPAELSGMPIAAEERLRICNIFGIAHLLDFYPDSVSAVEQTRTALASLVLAGRTILICEEPTGALHQVDANTVLALLRMCVRELGMTVITLTTDPMTAAYADRVYLLDNAKVAGDLRFPTLDSIFHALLAIHGESN